MSGDEDPDPAGAALTDAELAARLAAAAGAIALAVRAAGVLSDGALGDAGDQTADAFLHHALRAARPADGLLSEETRCDGSRLGRRRVWIVDPLDGTREYRAGRDDWAVHVGLAVDGVASVGAVALPARGLVLRSDVPLPPPPSPARRRRVVVSRNRPPAAATAIAAALDAELVAMGSAGVKAMAVATGDADVYFHTGGQHQWDNCAPVAVARAYGLHCSRSDGTPLVYNRADSRLDDLLICRPELAAPVLRLLRDGHRAGDQ